jgi:uncharacterized membrane protein required for colicin V production
MHWLDNTILAVLVAAALFGAYSGLLMQLCRVVGFGVALYAAMSFQDGVTGWLQESVLRQADERTCTVAAYALVFCGIYLGLFLLTLLVEHSLRAARLQYLNRGLGALLAVGKMGVLIGAICSGLQQLSYEPTSEALEHSAIAPVLVKGVEQLVAAVPPEYKEELATRWSQLRSTLSQQSGQLSLGKPIPRPGVKTRP